ncbi:MAG: hypothetical protein SGPRY_002169 [Prymnesium sp.]
MSVDCSRPTDAGLWGLARSARLEAQLPIGCIDSSLLTLPSPLPSLQAESENELAVIRSSTFVPRLRAARVSEPPTSKTDGPGARCTHLVTGGTGGLGLLTARWLGEHEGASLCLASRGGRIGASREWDALVRSCNRVRVVANDVGEAADAGKLVSSLLGEGPLSLWHTAGVLADGMLSKQNPATLRHSLAPKAHGAVRLHSATHAVGLRDCVLFSSMMGLLGGAGQANYAAANTLLDSLALFRRKRGSSGVSIQWAAWKEVGMASHGVASERLEALERFSGYGRIGLAFGLRAMSAVAGGVGPPVVGVLPFAWGKVTSTSRPPLLLELAPRAEKAQASHSSRSALPSTTSAPSAPGISFEMVDSLVSSIVGKHKGSADTPLLEAGLDSLGTVELRDKLQAAVKESGSSLILPTTLVFDAPTARALHTFLQGAAKPSPPPPTHPRGADRGDVEVVVSGTAVTLPRGVTSSASLWRMAHCGADLFTEIPSTRWDLERSLKDLKGLSEEVSKRARHGGFLLDAHLFDASFFGISKLEATSIDPNQRLLLERGYAALHEAGFTKRELMGSNVAVNVGQWESEFAATSMASPAADSVYGITGFQTAVTCGRVSFALGLHGPCCTFNTACSASLVASHSSLRALQRGECGCALSAGVNMLLDPAAMRSNAIASLTSVLGRSHTFDSRADGYGRGEAVTAVVTEPFQSSLGGVRLLGSAVRQDGRSASLTAPNGIAQVGVIGAAVDDARLTTGEVNMLEAHGTGTALGDPIEVTAVTTLLLDGRAEGNGLVVSSLKAMAGHTEPGAGLSGACKLMVQLLRGTCAPNAQLRKMNPHVRSALGKAVGVLPVAPVSVAGRTGGVSSFGYAGTIAHAVYSLVPGEGEESAETRPRPALKRSSFPWGGLPTREKSLLVMKKKPAVEEIDWQEAWAVWERGVGVKAAPPTPHIPARSRPPLVRLSVDDETRVGVVELDHVDHFNAIEWEMTLDLLEAVDYATQREDVRGLVIQGRGPHFSIGAYPHAKMDEASMAQLPSQISHMASGIASPSRLRGPLSCAVHGSLLGGGTAPCPSPSYG